MRCIDHIPEALQEEQDLPKLHPMKNTLILAALGLVTASAGAATLVVNNPSFESQSFSDGSYSGSITSWTATGGFVENPSAVAGEFGATQVINGSTNYAGTDGANSNLRQALTTNGTTAYNITAGDVFTVSMDIGRRGRNQENGPAFLIIEIVSAVDNNLVYASTTLDLQTAVGLAANTHSGSTWAEGNGQWLMLNGNQSPNASNTFTLTNTGTFSNFGDQAMIRLRAGTGTIGQIAMDNISVTVVPEPSIALLSGLGLLGLMRRRRTA